MLTAMEQRFLPMLLILEKDAGQEDRYTSSSGKNFISCGLNGLRLAALNFYLMDTISVFRVYWA